MPDNRSEPRGESRWRDDLRVLYAEGNAVRLSGAFDTGWRRMPLHACGQLIAGRTRAQWADGTKEEYGPGDGFYLPAGTLHRVTKIGKQVMESHWAHIGVAYGGAGGYDPLLDLDIPRRFAGPNARRIGRICRSLTRIHGRPITRVSQAARRMALQYELVAILTGLESATRRSVPLSQAAGGEDTRWARLAPAIQKMRQFPDQSLPLPSLAAEVHLSVSRFHVLFKQALGVAPHQYLQQLRIDLARRLLERGDEPVKIVARQVGFQNPILFYRHFRRIVGQSPRAYRLESRTVPTR